MKSTKVQNPRRILPHILRQVLCKDCANARALKLTTPHVVAVMRGAVSSRSNTG